MSDQRTVGGSAATQIRGFISRIQALDREIKELNAAKVRIYREAEVCGFDKEAMKQVIRRMALGPDATEQVDRKVALYEQVVHNVDERTQDPNFNPLKS